MGEPTSKELLETGRWYAQQFRKADLERMDRIRERDEARQRAERAEQLLQAVVDKATPYGEIDEPGGPYVRSYLLPTGPIHRALAYLREGSSTLAADPQAEAGGEEG